MRGLQRDQRTIWYCLYQGSEAVLDDEGRNIGSDRGRYSDPFEISASVSAATGRVNLDRFGTLEGYDKVIITHDGNCPIDENSLLFIDKPPEFNSDGEPVPDYVVTRVAKTPNITAIAASRTGAGYSYEA